LPPSLELANTDLANGIGSALISSGYNPTTMTGNLFLDKTFNDNTIYTYDLSNYIKLSLQNPQADKFGLLLLPPSPATTTQFTRVILGNSSLKVANKNATKLEIYYLTVQPQ
jgi:hypothetical protein